MKYNYQSSDSSGGTLANVKNNNEMFLKICNQVLEKHMKTDNTNLKNALKLLQEELNEAEKKESGSVKHIVASIYKI
ncbi:hypothetical protein pb186bvf_018124 [Paramecium bursaria]